MHEFPCPQPITLVVRIMGGALDVVAEERDTATVDVSPYDHSAAAREAAGGTRVELEDQTLVVEVPQNHRRLFGRTGPVRIVVRVPVDSALLVQGASATVDCQGRYASASINTASGPVRLDQVTGDATINTASGDARIGRVDGELRTHSASGEVAAEQVGRAVTAHSASGGITIERAGGSVQAQTASGDLRVGTASSGTVRAGTASGNVSVGVAAGTGVWLDLATMSGSTHNDLSMSDRPAGDGSADASLTLQVRTMSGDIDVHRVSQPSAG